MYLAEPFQPGELVLVEKSIVARITGIAAGIWQSLAPV